MYIYVPQRYEAESKNERKYVQRMNGSIHMRRSNDLENLIRFYLRKLFIVLELIKIIDFH